MNSNLLINITDKKVYLRGVNLYHQQKVYDLSIKNDQNYDEEVVTQITANVEASDGFTKYDVYILLSKNELIDYSCNCIYFLNNKNDQACKHLVATFLEYIENKSMPSKKLNTINSNNQFSLSNSLLFEYKKKSNLSLIKDKYLLKFSIVIAHQTVAIELSIYNHNNDKTYKVRDIKKLLSLHDEKEVYKITNNFSIDFKCSDFMVDEKNKTTWKIILNNYKMIDEFSIYSSDFFNGPYGIISITQLLEILESQKDQNVEVKFKTYYDNSENLVTYHISAKAYNFNFIHNEKSLNLQIDNYPKLLLYYAPILVENNTLYLMTLDQYQIYGPIYALFEKENTNQISFEINNLTDIVHYLLPNLKLLQNDLTLPETINKKIISQELEASFYLDYQNNEIIISPAFKYGEYLFELSNNFSPKISEDFILIRDQLKEKNIEEYLLVIGFEKKDNVYYLKNEDHYINFITNNIYQLGKLGVVYYSDSFKKINLIPKPQIKLFIKNSDTNLLDFSFKIDNVSDQELWEVFNSINNKKQYHRLTNGSIISLKETEDDDLFKLLETLDFDLTNKKQNTMKISDVNAIFLSKQLEKYDVEWETKNYYTDLFNNISNSPLNHELPIKLNAKLREYQKFGFQWLKTLSHAKLGGILADEMGLGKTIQAITFILNEFEHNSNLEPVIIISPSSLIYNWESEINKFASDLKVLVINGNPKKRQEMINNISNYQVIIISYPLLWKEINTLINIRFSYCFIDEAQYIKNLNSLSAKSVKKINADVRFALTGTPIENSLSELWSIFDYCLPGYLLSNYKFQKIFENPIVDKNDQEKLNIFRNKIKPFILRRLKKDVIDELPEKNTYNILIEMTDGQKKLYASYVKMAKKELEEQFKELGVEKTRIKFLSVLTRLRQICCDPSVFINNYIAGSGKMETLQNILDENIEENKILIFSQFTTVLKNIHQKLNAKKIKALYLDGQTKLIERKFVIEKFMSDNNYKIFLLSLKAGGVGLNLTKANIVIHFDPWWNPATENQATDRAHRIGQNKTVEVIRLIAKGTIEERILELHEKKLKLSQDIIDNNANLETLLTNLTEEEITKLLEFNF